MLSGSRTGTGKPDPQDALALESVTGYLARIGSVLASVPPEPLAAITDALLEAAREGRTVVILGNGGSAATASHFACDLAKTAAVPGRPRLRALSLTDNVPLLTALSNDRAYEDVFADQVRTYARADDVVIALSASGNSPNVLAAATAAREVGARVIGLTGFGGGSLRLMCDICLVVPSSEYGPVEDVHLVIVHAVTTAIREALLAMPPSATPSLLAGVVEDRDERDAAERQPHIITLRPQAAENVPLPVVFLDRDGVINRNRSGYVTSWDEFEFLPGALGALARLTHAGYRIFVVTNQACIGKGLVSHATIDDIHRRMEAAVRRAGGRIEGVLYCPHRPDAGCDCRKPKGGLLLRARDEYGVHLPSAIFIGDSAADMQAAATAGTRGMLVLSGLGWQTALGKQQHAPAGCALALNLNHASRLLLSNTAFGHAQQIALRSVVSGGRALARLRSVGYQGRPIAAPRNETMETLVRR